MKIRLVGALFVGTVIVAVGAALFWEGKSASQASTQPVTVAFIGDQGMNSHSRAVLQLIREEGSDLVLHQGDLDYVDDPAGWDAFVTEVLGANFPYLASVGNHDILWYVPGGYQERLQARLDRIDELSCVGDLGAESACRFKGLFIILSGIGTTIKKGNAEHIAYLRNQLDQSDSIWRICSWHKTQKLMQLGGKSNEVGWKPFKACRKGGAIVATAHVHAYSRTHLMKSFKRQEIASTADRLVIEKGRSFAFVSGLGGYSIYPRERPSDPWWASIYGLEQDASYGALFCTFFVDGKPDLARCYFKDINGNVPDRFEIISKVNAPK